MAWTRRFGLVGIHTTLIKVKNIKDERFRK